MKKQHKSSSYYLNDGIRSFRETSFDRELTYEVWENHTYAWFYASECIKQHARLFYTRLEIGVGSQSNDVYDSTGLTGQYDLI